MYILIIVLTIGAGILAGWIIFVQRELNMMQEILKDAMSQIGVQLSFRWDVLAAMMELARGYGVCENRAFAEAVKARHQVDYKSTARDASEQEILFQKGMGYIQAVILAYPEIRHDKAYITLMDSIRIYEGMFCQSRLIYNDGVTRLNRRIRKFPANLAAGIMGIKAQDYLEMKEDLVGEETASIISQGLYDNVLEADLTNDRLIGKNCAELLELLGLSRDASYSECIEAIIRKMVKPEYHMLYGEKFGREQILRRFQEGERQFSLEFEERPDLVYYQRTTAAVCIYQDKRDQAVRIVSYVRHNQQDKEWAILEKEDSDSLTGLPGRRAAEHDISTILRRNKPAFHALLLTEFVEVDGMNQSIKLVEGEQTIKELGAFLRIQFRENDIVSRLNGVRFMILMQNCGSEQSVQDKMKVIQERLQELHLERKESACLAIRGGAALYKGDGEVFAELYSMAETALNHLKESGQSSVLQFAHFQTRFTQ